ncbi:MAG: hypothetical protein GF353_10380 [Candidatus Lokiarchaeota archaeon]|nr:hypothetical protein [Candidatus Lokiarchaeota archaeon]
MRVSYENGPYYLRNANVLDTYWAVPTLDVLLENFSGYSTQCNNLVQWINSSQLLCEEDMYRPSHWNLGGFRDDLNDSNSFTLEHWEVSMLLR